MEEAREETIEEESTAAAADAVREEVETSMAEGMRGNSERVREEERKLPGQGRLKESFITTGKVLSE